MRWQLIFALCLLTGSLPLHAQTVVDKKFVALESAQLGMGLLDAGLTQSCIRAGTCKEGNPWMPSSAAGQYGVVLGSSAVETIVAYEAKKHGLKLWWVPTVGAFTAHTIGAGTGLKYQAQWRFAW